MMASVSACRVRVAGGVPRRGWVNLNRESCPRPRLATWPPAFSSIFAKSKRAQIHAEWEKTREEFAARFLKLGPLEGDATAEVLALTGFPRSHWAQDLAHQPGIGPGQQGDHAPCPCGRDSGSSGRC